MQKRPALTDENTAEVGLSAQQFQEALKAKQAGVRFVYTCSQANLKGLSLPHKVLVDLLNQTCYLPTPEPLTTVRKIIPVKFDLDLANRTDLPPTLKMELGAWDPSPANKLEIVNGPPAGFRKDFILLQKIRIRRIWNTAPFGALFRSNLCEFYQGMQDAIADESFGRPGVEWPTFSRSLTEKDGSDLFFTANVPEEGVDLPPKIGEITQDLESATGEMSAACFYCRDPENLRNGLVEFEMPHPVTRALTWFIGMCCTHLVATYAVTNWKLLNLQIGPLVEKSTNTYTYIMERDLCNELIASMVEEMPKKSFAVPSDSLVFGTQRHPMPTGTQDVWHANVRLEPANADLYRRFTIKSDVELSYALLPESLRRNRPLGLDSAGPAMASYNNKSKMAKRLEKSAQAAVEADMLAEFSFTKLHISEGDDNSTKQNEDSMLE